MEILLVVCVLLTHIWPLFQLSSDMIENEMDVIQDFAAKAHIDGNHTPSKRLSNSADSDMPRKKRKALPEPKTQKKQQKKQKTLGGSDGTDSRGGLAGGRKPRTPTNSEGCKGKPLPRYPGSPLPQESLDLVTKLCNIVSPLHQLELYTLINAACGFGFGFSDDHGAGALSPDLSDLDPHIVLLNKTVVECLALEESTELTTLKTMIAEVRLALTLHRYVFHLATFEVERERLKGFEFLNLDFECRVSIVQGGQAYNPAFFTEVSGQ